MCMLLYRNSYPPPPPPSLPPPHPVVLAEDRTVLHCPLLQLHIQVVAIATDQGLDPRQRRRKPEEIKPDTLHNETQEHIVTHLL